MTHLKWTGDPYPMTDAAPWPWVNRGLACGSLLQWHQHGGQHTNFLQIIQAPPVTKTASALALRDSSVPTIENADGRRDASGRTHWRPNQVLSMMTSAGPFTGISISIFFSGSHYAGSCQWIKLQSFLPSRLGTSSRLIIKRWRIVGKLGHEASNG